MPTAFDQAFRRVKELVADFRANEKFYLSPAYQEQEARHDFIDKFWLALGWDVNHDEQKNPYAQEVKVERSGNEDFARKRADYAFYLAPNFRDVRFYVEAKRPSGDFASSDNYLQIIRYGWFTKETSPFSVLTSFEDFHILDCRLTDVKDTLSRVVERFTCDDYTDSEKFARIYWLFSREAVGDGSLEKLAGSRPSPKSKKFRRGLFKGGDTKPDNDFLEELDGYRQKLAQAFKKKNPDLDGELLTEVTQRTLDRLVFTRFSKTRELNRHRSRILAGRKALGKISSPRRSGLIANTTASSISSIQNLTCRDFSRRGRSLPASARNWPIRHRPTISTTFPSTFWGAFTNAFSARSFPTARRVVEKPEVRKAGGVYYTPEYIVRYIVENTVGKMIAGKSPAQIAEMRFADIACGSGSFLLGVYDLLLRYHARYYSENPGKVKKGDCVRRDGLLHLSLQKKRDILVNNIYGVDIDRQAVEVAQLSLYLKLLEDETIGSTSEFQTEFHFTLLPSLDKNIVCGNSLIEPDILDNDDVSAEEQKKINPLDYAQRFPRIFRRKAVAGELHDAPTPISDYTMPGVPLHGAFSYKKKKDAKVSPRAVQEFEGGFDAIVGNPPYIRIQRISAKESRYMFQHYQWPTSKMDLSLVFLERGLRLTQRRGLVGFICTSQWLAADYGKKIRGELANGYLHKMVDFGSLPVFQNASTYPAILILSPTPATELSAKKITSRESLNSDGIAAAPSLAVPLSSLSARPWTIGSFDISTAAQTRGAVCRPLGEFGKAYIGTKCGMNEAFVLTRSEAKRLGIEKEILFPYAYRGAEVERYGVVEPDSVIIYPYRPDGDGDAKLISEPELKTKFPKAHAHLLSFKDALRQRQDSRRFYAKGLDWYRHLRAGSFNYIRPIKLALKGIAKECSVGLLQQKAAFDGARCPCVILENLQGCSPNYFLGLLNSKLATFQLKAVCPPKLNNYIEFSARAITSFPVRAIDFSNSSDKARHDRMVELVEQMLAARKQLAGAQSDKDKDFYTNRSDSLDRQIDSLVYELYGLSPEEIKIVEGENKFPVGQPLSNAPE